ncbi:MAG: YlxR family protein [Clostridia bacterium]|nr:YlxR family protein [Clostridia bacterium]
MQTKKQPLRMCIGCMEMKPKAELIRIVRDKEGNISLDKKGRAPGRGAYLCNALACYEKAVKGKKIERAFKTAISAEVYAALGQAMQDA